MYLLSIVVVLCNKSVKTYLSGLISNNSLNFNTKFIQSLILFLSDRGDPMLYVFNQPEGLNKPPDSSTFPQNSIDPVTPNNTIFLANLS